MSWFLEREVAVSGRHDQLARCRKLLVLKAADRFGRGR